MSTLPQYTMRELMEAGIHFGHKTMRWNPKMASYIYGVRDKVHIIDLQQTVPLLDGALELLRKIAKDNGRILFVGTKKQASEIVAESAKRCGQYYVNHRWLGGMLTNWNTVSKSIITLKQLEEKINIEESLGANSTITKKEKLNLIRKYQKINLSLGGIRDMGGKPDILFIIDTNKESIAIQEAKTLGIPIIAVIDTNSNPDNITYPIPGNDDASRAIRLYCRLVSEAILSGIQDSLTASGTATEEKEELLPNFEVSLSNNNEVENKLEDSENAKPKKTRVAKVLTKTSSVENSSDDQEKDLEAKKRAKKPTTKTEE
jgi:small subunit ribosomal protein S2